MTSRVLRLLAGLGLVTAVAFAVLLPNSTRIDANSTRAVRSAVQPSGKLLPVALTSTLIRQGMKLVPWAALLEVNARARFVVGFSRQGVTITTEGAIGKSINEVNDRLQREKNETLQKQLKVMLDRLKEDKERNRLLAEQNKLVRTLINLQVQSFERQKWVAEEAVLRKSSYSVPAGKLVVVVADFSSGNLAEGREVADEIAHHLKELRKHDIDIHVMAGEIKPGIVIRSEEMARDVARHFPPGTDYVCIWGSMSPRTVGKYRPHLTCVQHVKGSQEASVTTSIDLDSGELPEKGKEEAYQRECYHRLIGATCAAIPSLYAAHLISREETPRLKKFYEFLGDSAETKQFQEKLEPLIRWSQAREKRKDFPVRRLADISSTAPYPLTIANEKDNSVLVLITDEKGQPRRFINKETKKEEIVYIDVLETTTGQFVRFLNEQGGNKEGGGQPWLKIDPKFADIVETAKDQFGTKEADKRAKHRAVMNVSWFGASAYCKWSGKDLPREEEWAAAAQPNKGGSFPWGKDGARFKECCNANSSDNRPGGEFVRDRSRIGCFDMAGNLAEWCSDWFDEKDPVSKRVVKGGSFSDKDAALFAIGSRRAVDQVKHERWIGFRGVIRIPIETTAK